MSTAVGTLNIVADENIAGVDEFFASLGTVRTLKGREIQAEDLCGADVLLVRSVTRVDEDLLAGTAVSFVGTATSGFDHVDRAYLERLGIAFAHAPGSNANSVVEYVLGAVASVDDKLEQLFAGGTVGIIGFGYIGKLLAYRLEALGVAYRVYDPWLDPVQVTNSASLTQVLSCDVVSVHAELTGNDPWPSFHLLGPSSLSLMSSGTLLINASRGAVIDNAALEKYLRDSPRLTVILDVWEDEPSVSEALLLRVRSGTAHIAGYSLDGKRLASYMLRASLLDHLGITEEGCRMADPQLVISLPNAGSGASLLRELLHYNYCIDSDDSLLREAVIGQSPAAVAANFDRLRRQYGSRREVFGAEVQAVLSDPADIRLVEAMGCTLRLRPEEAVGG